MKKYTPINIPPDVEAIEWDGFSDVENFQRYSFFINNIELIQIFNENTINKIKYVSKGDYIVKYPDGSYQIMKPSEFEKTYKPIVDSV